MMKEINEDLHKWSDTPSLRNGKHILKMPILPNLIYRFKIPGECYFLDIKNHTHTHTHKSKGIWLVKNNFVKDEQG